MSALLARQRLFMPECLIADRVQRDVEHRLVIAAVVFQHLKILIDDFIVVRERIGRNQISPPDFGRINVQLMCSEVEQPLHHEYAVLASGTAIRCHRRQIGEDLRKRAVIGGHDIGTEQGTLAVDRHRQPIGIEGAAIVQEHVLDAEDAAVAAERHFCIVNLTALVGGGKKMFMPILDPFDRAVQLHRNPGKQYLFGIKHHDLGPKAAADERRDDANLSFVQPEHAGKAVADEHRRLRRIPDRHLVGAPIPLRDHAAGFDRRGNAVLIPEPPLDDAIGLGRRRCIIALGLADVGRDIGADVVVNQRRSRAETLFHIDHGGKLLEFDVDIVERILGDITALRDHDDQRLADMAGLVLGQRHLGSLVEDDAFDRRRRHQDRAGLPVVAEVAGNIGCDDAGTLQCLENIDLQDSRMRDLAAQKRGVKHPRQFEVIDEQGLAGEKPMVFVAFYGLAEGTSGHVSAPHPICGRQHGIDDILVTGAAAQIARQRLAHLVLARRAVFIEKGGYRHQNAGRAIAALQAVMFVHRLLQRMIFAGLVGKALDG